MPEHDPAHVDIAARAAYSAVAGWAHHVKADGYQEGLGYDELPEAIAAEPRAKAAG